MIFEGFFQADLAHGVKRYLETIDNKEDNQINSLMNSTLLNITNFKGFSKTFRGQSIHKKRV